MMGFIKDSFVCVGECLGERGHFGQRPVIPDNVPFAGGACECAFQDVCAAFGRIPQSFSFL